MGSDTERTFKKPNVYIYLCFRLGFLGIDCGTPTRLPGSLPYRLTSTAYSAQFTFSCRRPLFTRVGNSGINSNEVVTCGADGVWDFGDLHCEGVCVCCECVLFVCVVCVCCVCLCCVLCVCMCVSVVCVCVFVLCVVCVCCELCCLCVLCVCVCCVCVCV